MGEGGKVEPDWKGQGEAASAELVVGGSWFCLFGCKYDPMFVECYPGRPCSR